MTPVMAVVVGALYAAGVYLMLRRSLVKVLVGLCLVSHGANLLIFTAGRTFRGAPPLVPPGAVAPPVGFVDPVPQALILTAIVIGFAVLAFALVLVHGVYRTVGTDDVDEMRTTE